VLAVGFVLAAFSAAAPTANATGAFSVQPVQIIVHVGTTSDPETCTVDADIYKPVTATAAHPEPAVLETNGFVGDKSQLAVIAGDIAADGYVDLAYSGLGWGGTTCPISIDDPDYDGMAASELVDFLAGTRAATNGTTIDYVKRDRHGPIVGMVGGSYAGGVQFAAVDAEMQRFGYSRIRTIIPLITWNNLTYSIAPNNAGLPDTSVSNPVPGVEKEVWSAELFGTGVPGVTIPPTVNPGHLGTCGDIEPDLCSPFTDSIAEGYPDSPFTALLQHASVHFYMSKIHVPVMLMQGEDDSLFELHESVATYEQLRAQGTPVKLVWQSWGHTDGTPQPGEFGYVDGNTALSDADGYLTFEGRLITEWLNHYLKGAPQTPSLDFSFYRPWVKYPGMNAALAYGRAPTYPIGKRYTLDLSSSDQLIDQGALVQTGSASFITPAGGAPTSTGETTNETDLPPHDVPGTFAEFETAPLAANVDVIGIPSVRLTIEDPLLPTLSPLGPGGDLTLFFKLYDISPAGGITLPDGLVAATRIADVSRPVTVTLPAIVHQFAKGDRLALVIAGSDSEYRGDAVSQPVTILTSASRPGQLQLPVAPPSSYGPVIYAGAPVASLHVTRHRGALTVRWSGTDNGGAGIVAFQLQERIGNHRWFSLRGFAATTRRSARIPATQGHKYEFRVRAKDAGGNWSLWAVSRL
jgi:X-Pro dipeptidyl-peptidase C-terminal non-catalytic domain